MDFGIDDLSLKFSGEIVKVFSIEDNFVTYGRNMGNGQWAKYVRSGNTITKKLIGKTKKDYEKKNGIKLTGYKWFVSSTPVNIEIVGD